ncbi:MAG TPA: mechanosensitive ion channel domain-containing protein [Candidatus Saccharimonadales bacterium]|nr:mechanosensitive ion channel domain-containing protein [Candidatus Saccharimonadales bacterium]
MRWFFLILSLFSSFFSLQALELGKNLTKELTTPKIRILLRNDLSDRYKYVENLKLELQSLEQRWKESYETIEQKRLEIQAQIEELKDQPVKKSNFLTKKFNYLIKLDQAFKETEETKIQILEFLKQHIEFWEKYFADSTHQSNGIEDKSLYSFLDLQNIMKRIFFQEELLDGIIVKKEETVTEISKEEYIVATKEKEFEHVQQLLEEKKKQTEKNKEDITLLDFEKEVITKQRELASLKLHVLAKKQEFFNSKESILQDRLQQLKDHINAIRSRLYVDILDVQNYEQKNNEQKKLTSLKKAELIKLRNEIAAQKIAAQEELDRLRKRFKLTFTKMAQLEDIEVSTHSISDSFAWYSIARAYVTVATYERLLHKIKIDMMLQDSKMQQSQIILDTVKLLYEISQGHIKDTETFEKERIGYKEAKQALQISMKANKEQMLCDHILMKDLQRILAHVKKQQDTMTSLSGEVSGFLHKKWSDSFIMLSEMIKNIEEQHEVMLQKNEIYEQIVSSQEETLESLNCILAEFDTIGVWHRSISAVTWEGIKNIGPNLIVFLRDVKNIIVSYISKFTLHNFAYGLSELSLGKILGIFVMICMLFVIFIFLQALLPTLYKSLINVPMSPVDSLHGLRQIGILFLGFLIDVFKPLYVWLILLLYIIWQDSSAAVLVLFYGYTIFFGIYASRKLLMQFIYINRKFDYFLLSKRLIDRFSWVFLFFSISTIIILVFRKMFMLVMLHQQSEFPNILLRIYHIVIFISIVLSLDKEELLQLLPKKSSLGEKVALLIEHYYYLVLLTIFSLLIISDPYLGGYGSLMWHLSWNIFVSICVLALLFIGYMIIRQYSTFLFFKEDESLNGSCERFDYAKTWYAIYILSLICAFSIIAVVLCAEIWGYGFTYATLRKIVMYELFKIESVSCAGKTESFKVFNLLYILFVSFCGVVLAYIFKKVVLKRVFDIQYVDPGIQNTVIIISRYVIIITVVVIACIQSKLGSLVTGVFYVALVITGWSFKDLFTDFVAYFFILVQRPVKLGDYVKIDSETMGVVRKISPRAVILRRKNSLNIVVPNSTVLKSSLCNWNYTRGYIGLDDIIFSVPFGTDITIVKDVCFKVFDEDGDILKVPQPFVRLQDFGDKGYVFMIRAFVSSGNTLRQWDIASNIRFALVESLAKEGISIAGPSMKVLVAKELVDNNFDR